jgi:sugar phosphate isomerase/epimerase
MNIFPDADASAADVESEHIGRRSSLRRLAGSVLASNLIVHQPAFADEHPGPAEEADPAAQIEQSPRQTNMGLVIYDYNILRRQLKQKHKSFDLFEPLTFLRHCHRVGAGGMQASLGVLQPQQGQQLRQFAGEHDLFIDAIIRPPKDDSDLDRFTAEIETARDVGVQAARTTIIPGRRYERFQTLEEFKLFERRGREMLERAAPVVEKHRVRFAVENHKDQRLDERIALFKHLDSEYIGACVDTGNSFALLDGAYEPIAALAPYAFTVHLKDQALQPYDDGFLLGDCSLGDGSFDLKRMVRIIRDARPDIHFALELITRDPLKVPCLKNSFYSTMPNLPATNLARTLRFVNEHKTAEQQYPSKLNDGEQAMLEHANVMRSLKYAGTELKL